MKLILLAILQAVLVTADVSERSRRQTQPFYTSAIPIRGGPTPKPQPFSSNGPQTIVPRFPPLNSAPHGFRSSPVDEETDEIDRNAVSPTPQYLLVRPQPTQQPQQYRSPPPQQYSQQPPNQQLHQQQRARPSNNQEFRRPNLSSKNQQQLTEEELADLEEEKEEPDRLTELLPNSKFSCSNRNTGYYADEGLNCEVFHYCQDNARHSWICPEGFLFHQVHLICMPPSSDNICKQSSQFHFVNDYLYRPINAEEVQRKPNVTLRYADRYYPENYYEEGEEGHASAPVRRPAAPPPQNQNYQQQVPARTPIPQQYRQASTTNQVFHSPEEVNIPLQHRRPQYQQSSSTSEEDY